MCHQGKQVRWQGKPARRGARQAKLHTQAKSEGSFSLTARGLWGVSCLQAALAPGKIAGLWSPAVPATGPGLLGMGGGGQAVGTLLALTDTGAGC